MRIQFTAPARRDLDAIETYIAEDSPDVARKTILALQEKCRFIAKHPRVFAPQPKFGHLRKHSLGSYLIFYRVVKEGVEIVRILHGSRDLQKALQLYH
jgi:toxin ParE1/3/4